MSTPLVKEFNTLPRKAKAPSGTVPNEWHFDLRYIQIDPHPSHIVVIIQPQSQFIHMERLPLGIPANASGIAFFPESGKQAAPEVAKALLYAFVTNLGHTKVMATNAPPSFAPWKLTTEDKDLAAAVGDEFKRLGVRALELHTIGISKKSVNKLTDDVFRRLFADLKTAIGLTGISRDVVQTPQSIAFHNFKLTPRPRISFSNEEEGPFELALKYNQQFANARPPKAQIDSKTLIANEVRGIEALLLKVETRPESVVKAEADAGDSEAAFDYGLRLLVGLGCKVNRTLSRDYLVAAILSHGATDEIKATAHGILIDWYVSSCVDDFRSRYLFAASHHANIAAALCKRVSPPGTHASPSVLWFMSKVFEPQSHGAPELYMWFKDAVSAMEFRNAQVAGGRQKMELKRLKNPNRYCCAAVGCGIEADSGKMLLRCAGKCDSDKKPSYCSKQCQTADWKNHKLFCIPGAACSVLDSGNVRSGVGPSSKQGAIQIPITHADGSTHVVSSSTLDPQMLKEIRDYAQGSAGASVAGMTMDIERIDL